jgi:hypothetical protein
MQREALIRRRSKVRLLGSWAEQISARPPPTTSCLGKGSECITNAITEKREERREEKKKREEEGGEGKTGYGAELL